MQLHAKLNKARGIHDKTYDTSKSSCNVYIFLQCIYYGFVLGRKRDKDLNFSSEIQHDKVSTGNIVQHINPVVMSIYLV